MQVEVDITEGVVRLVEPHVFEEIVIAAIGAAAPEHVWAVLERARAGRADLEDPEAAWVDLDWIRAEAAGRVEATWVDGFNAWVEERRAAGDLSAGGDRVRARLDYAGPRGA